MSNKKSLDKKLSSFSVPLGLLDYVNPVFYTITSFVILSNMKESMNQPYYGIYLVGVVLSLIFGFIIPTGKLLVGLKIIEFRMPVSLVFCVNLGIFLSGIMLLKTVFSFPIIGLILLMLLVGGILFMIYRKSHKFNSVAVMLGAFGYVFLYIALITLSIQKAFLLNIFLYACAILLFIFLCGIGMKANLKDAKVHWVIEISNVVCQGLVALSTFLLFH